MEYQLFIVKDSFKEVINENLIRLLSSFSHDQYYEIQINKIFDYIVKYLINLYFIILIM